MPQNIRGFYMAIPRWLTKPVGYAAKAAGAVQNVLPGQGNSTLYNAGNAILDPNRVYAGSLNPFSNPNSGSSNIHNGGTSGFVNVSHGVASAPANNPNQTQQTNPYGDGTNSNPYDSYTYGGGSDLLGGIQDKIRSIMAAYDALSGGTDSLANEQVGNINKQYDQNFGNLNDTYQSDLGQIGSQYAGRGLGQSSFLGEAQGQRSNQYNTDLNSLLDQRNNAYGQVGQAVSGAKGGYNSAKQQYGDMLNNLGGYTPDQLSSLDATLGGTLSNLGQQEAGLGTNSSFMQALNAIAPLHVNTQSMLTNQLQKLAQSSAPSFAKNQIAQGIIKQAGIDDPTQQSVWANYWQQLLGGAGA